MNLQANVTPSPWRHVIACIGDSLTLYHERGVHVWEQYPRQAQDLLRALGCHVTFRNYGVPAQDTANMYARAQQVFTWEDPACLILYGGENDPGDGIAQADTTINLRCMARMYRAHALGIVATEAALPAAASVPIPQGALYVVRVDGSATGGVSPEITGAPGGIQLWANRNPQPGVAGWGRVRMPAGGEKRKVIIVTRPFRNYTVGADTPAVEVVAAAPIRAAQRDAAHQEDCALYDWWQYGADQITAGIVTQGDWVQYHPADGDHHPNNRGARWCAKGLVEFLAATKAAWLQEWVQ